MKILCIGDVVARPGRLALTHGLQQLREDLSADFVIVNGENSAGGSGLDKKCYREIIDAGADCITLGDHTWRRAGEVKPFVTTSEYRCIAPANYPPAAGVIGYQVRDHGSVSLGVANIMCRTFMNASLDCPFQKMEDILAGPFGQATIRIVDLHGEATSEKIAFAKHFDGKLSLVFGTHTHVQTADEEVLQGGTARITDIGMTGSHAGVIGMDATTAILRFVNGRPSTYKPATEDARIHGIIVECADTDGRALSIERVARKIEC